MLKFSNPYMFFFLAAIPLLVLALILFIRWKKKQMRLLFDERLTRTLVPQWSPGKITGRFVFIMLIYALLVVVLARPKFGLRIEEVKMKGVDFVIALDVSSSMLAQDIKPTRLDRARQSVSSLLDKLNGDRVGLVVFSGMADVQSPVTNDYASIKMLLPTIDTDMMSAQGTSLSEAISVSIQALPPDRKGSAAIILITDGEDHEGEAVTLSKKAKADGIFIHTIGVGSVQGAPIPVYKNGTLSGYKTDRQGNTVITKLNEASLQELAQVGGGIYVRGTNPTSALEKVFQEVTKMEKQQLENTTDEGLQDRFQWVLIFVIILMAAELVYSERASKFLKKIELFDK